MLIDFSFMEEDEVFDMAPLDERTDLFPVRSVDGVFADASGNVDLGGARDFTTDETLSFENGVLSVNTAKEPDPDNTLPITSAAVAVTVGNIAILLETI